MTRNDFLKICVGCLGTGFLFLEGCKVPLSLTGTLTDNKLSISKADFATHKFALVRHAKLSAPVYLLKKSETEYIASLMTCTHKGCELTPTGNILVCPCHGSEFSGDGKVLSPPADKDLAHFPVTVTDTHLIIQLSS